MKAMKYNTTGGIYDFDNFKMWLNAGLISYDRTYGEPGDIIVEYCTPQGWRRLAYHTIQEFATDWMTVEVKEA